MWRSVRAHPHFNASPPARPPARPQARDKPTGPRSAKQHCVLSKGEENFLSRRAKLIICPSQLENILEEESDERQRRFDAEADALAAARRAEFSRGWDAPGRGRGGGAGARDEASDDDDDRPLPPPPLGDGADKARRELMAARLANRDIDVLPAALLEFYYPSDGTSTRARVRRKDEPLPDKVYIVQSGCIAAQLMHHPADLDRRAYQSVYATPSYRGQPRFSRVAVVPGDEDEEAGVWRGEVRLLFRAEHPSGKSPAEKLALIKYFEYTSGAGRGAALPPSLLTHTFRPAPAGAAGGSGGASGSRRPPAAPPMPRFSPDGSRYTGAIRMRFAPEGKNIRYRFAVVGLRSLVRVEHVLTDFNKQGLDGSFESYYVNPWKWSLENVGDDDGRGELLNIASL